MRNYGKSKNYSKPMSKTAKVLIWIFTGCGIIAGILFIPFKGTTIWTRVTNKILGIGKGVAK